MSGNPTIIETIARAIYAATHRACCNGSNPAENDDAWRSFKIEAKAAIAAIEQSGHAIVQTKPTAALMDFGGEIFFEREWTPGIWEKMLKKQGPTIQAGKVKP